MAIERDERYPDLSQMLRVVQDGLQARIWTALPGTVTKYNSAKLTCEVKPAVPLTVDLPDGTTQSKNLPLLLDCPVYFPTGGGFTLTFPVKPGDECLVVFASRCIDSWWQQGDKFGPPPEFRMHDLSDGFVFVGFRSQVNLLSPAPDGNNVQLRSDDGDAYVEITPGGAVNVVAPGGALIDGDTEITGVTLLDQDLNVLGNLNVAGDGLIGGNLTVVGIITSGGSGTGGDGTSLAFFF